MKLFITGGTGLIGSALIAELHKRGDEISILSRDAQKARKKLGSRIDVFTSLDDLPNFDEYDVVINLAGESIADERWTESQKAKLCNSRWDMTHQLSILIRKSEFPPSVFISGSAVGYYGNQGRKEVIESTRPHEEFTHYLCDKWESLAMAARSEKTRVCISRTGIVLSPKGGMLDKLKPLFSKGLGAILGSGDQYISWIHIDDMVSALIYLIDNPELEGAFNLTAPNPVTNKKFSKTLAKQFDKLCFLCVPSFMLKLGLGELATMLLDGQKVIPDKLSKQGFKHYYETIEEALGNVVRK